MEGTLTDVFREEGAEEDSRVLFEPLTGSWRILKNEDFLELYR